MNVFIKRNNWYRYGFYNDIMQFIKDCPLCKNFKLKFKNIKTGIKIIFDKGPHYLNIADLWYLSKELSNYSSYKYILDIIDHFFKWYQGYALKTKSANEILTYIVYSYKVLENLLFSKVIMDLNFVIKIY